VRIISGKNKGRKIIAPNHLPVRPTTDFAKEAVFNILCNQFDLNGMEVLDLFSGTGNIAYEFISRNVKNVVAVDINIACTKFIQLTAEKLNYNNLSVIRADYRTYIRQTNRKWDLIFADPPYEMEEVKSLPSVIFEKQMLKPGGILILEHKRAINFGDYPKFTDHRSYGRVNFSFFTEKN
jgi:16S rRNA (guanine(966)-N(2))-methyltransferase RsmD